MFGYIVVHKPELKVREYETYRASYCGLCHSLKKQSGRIGQLTLSFDMTFLALLLTGLYEPETVTKSARCIAHPVEKHFYRENRYFDYAADMNVLLTYYKCLDDWQDERKLTACLFGQALKGNVKKLVERYERQSRCLRDNLAALSAYEKEKQYDIDKTAGFFGAIMAELFVYAEDEWAEKLRRMGFYFGKFIYLMDAYEDLPEDRKKNRYNPLKELAKRPDYEVQMEQILRMMIAESTVRFEQLPCLVDVDILRNILYDGVWNHYNKIQMKKREEKNDDKKSI